MTTVTAASLPELFMLIRGLPLRMKIAKCRNGWIATMVWDQVPNRGNT